MLFPPFCSSVSHDDSLTGVVVLRKRQSLISVRTVHWPPYGANLPRLDVTRSLPIYTPSHGPQQTAKRRV